MAIWKFVLDILELQTHYMFFLFGFAVMFFILGVLSRRLGQAMNYPRYYLGYFIIVFLIVGLAITQVYIEKLSPTRTNNDFFIAMGSVLAVILVVASLVTYKYWGWLLKEFFSPKSD